MVKGNIGKYFGIGVKGFIASVITGILVFVLRLLAISAGINIMFAYLVGIPIGLVLFGWLVSKKRNIFGYRLWGWS